MITQIINEIILLAGILFQVFYRLNKKISRNKPVTMEDYLFKISRITGKSEYDIFCKSAEDWPVSEQKIRQDFSRYLSQQTVPHYVNDFVRKNKKHIDELHMPLF